jgi:predicted nucleic acid-binding Zn ribbon protein
MGIATGMRHIVRDITSSTNARMADVKGIKKDTKEMLGSFKASQDKMNARLNKNLAHDKAEMVTGVKAMQNRFRTSHKEMGASLKHDLAEHSQRVGGAVAKMRQDIGTAHQDMSERLKKNLSSGAAALKSETNNMLDGFRRSQKQQGTQLKKELAAHNRGIKSEVSGMRQEMKSDMKQARTAWQGLGTARKAKSAAVKAPSKASAPVPTNPTAPVPIKAAAPVPDGGTSNLETKMLSTIVEYPAGGINLKDIAGILGVAPVVLGKASTSLIKRGKIRRQNKVYFPAVNN